MSRYFAARVATFGPPTRETTVRLTGNVFYVNGLPYIGTVQILREVTHELPLVLRGTP